MHGSREYLILIIILFIGLVFCAGCTQKAGPGPLVTAGETPGVPASGQPDPSPAMGTCLPPQVWCNGRCADISAERENCGACGALCPEGKICRNTQCVAGDVENPNIPGIPGTTPVATGSPVIPGTTTGGSSCSSGQTNCYGTCTDLQSDVTHCGACNTKCPSGKVCSAGTCSISCGTGLDNCGGSCTNTRTSSLHCGKCNNPCSSGQTCQNSKCGLYMSVATLDPHDICINSGHSWCWGTCSDLQTDENNCGSCGNKCPSGQTCQNAKCGVYVSIIGSPDSICKSSGKAWCTNTCVDPMTDPDNCGSCLHACKKGQACSGGKCQCSGSICQSWTGRWGLTGLPGQGDGVLSSMSQAGSSVTGSTTYTKFSGTSNGNPPILSGTWWEQSYPGKTPPLASGTIEWVLSSDGTEFTGWVTLNNKSGKTKMNGTYYGP